MVATGRRGHAEMLEALLSHVPEHQLGIRLQPCVIRCCLDVAAFFTEACGWRLRPGTFRLCFRLKPRCIASAVCSMPASACYGQLTHTVAWSARPVIFLMTFLNISDTCRYAASLNSLKFHRTERDT